MMGLLRRDNAVSLFLGGLKHKSEMVMQGTIWIRNTKLKPDNAKYSLFFFFSKSSSFFLTLAKESPI